METVVDLVKLLEAHPQWRRELLRALLTEEFLALPESTRRLEEAVQRLAAGQEALQAALQRLGEAQARTEARLEELARAQARTEARLEELARAQARTEARLEELAQAQARTEARLEELAQAQARTEARLEELAQAQARTEEGLRQLAARVGTMDATLEWLAGWQRGEAGRREGERFERDVVRRAPLLFAGGDGGSAGEGHVRERLGRWLAPALARGEAPEPSADPSLADLLWWKGERVLVVEASLKVNGEDVERALARAGTLQACGVAAAAVVVGEEWASEMAAVYAREKGVEWLLKGAVSPGVVAFRRLRDGAAVGEA